MALRHRNEAHCRTMFDPRRVESTDALEASARGAFMTLAGAIAQVRPNLTEESLTRCARQSWSIAHGAVLLGFDDSLSKVGGPSDAQGIADEVVDAIIKLVIHS